MITPDVSYLIEKLISEQFEQYLENDSFYEKDDSFLFNLKYYSRNSVAFVDYLREHSDYSNTVYINLLKLFPFSQKLIKAIISSKQVEMPDTAFVDSLKVTDGLYQFLVDFKKEITSGETTKVFNDFHKRVEIIKKEIEAQDIKIAELKNLREQNRDLIDRKNILEQEIENLKNENNRDKLNDYIGNLEIEKKHLQEEQKKYKNMAENLNQARVKNSKLIDKISEITSYFNEFPKDLEDK